MLPLVEVLTILDRSFSFDCLEQEMYIHIQVSLGNRICLVLQGSSRYSFLVASVKVKKSAEYELRMKTPILLLQHSRAVTADHILSRRYNAELRNFKKRLNFAHQFSGPLQNSENYFSSFSPIPEKTSSFGSWSGETFNNRNMWRKKSCSHQVECRSLLRVLRM